MDKSNQDKIELNDSNNNNNLELFKKIINSTTNIEKIYFSVFMGDYDTVKNRYVETKLPIMHFLASKNAFDFFKFLHVEKKMSLNHRDGKNLLPLHYACINHSTDVALYILNEDSEKSQLNSEHNKHWPFLYCAALGGDIQIIKSLLDSGLKITDPWINEFDLVKCAYNYPDVTSFLLSQCSPNAYQNSDGMTLAIYSIINHSFETAQIVYRGEEDIKAHYYDRSGYHSLIEEFVNSDFESHKYKKFLLRILDDVLKLDLSIEPPKVPGKNQAGVCHWACIYNDLEVAKIMIKTKDFDINRIDVSHQIGAIRLIEKTGNNVADMIELLIEEGIDINYRYDLKTNTLLESFIHAIKKNYKAIEIIVKYCADIYAMTTRHTDRYGHLLNIDEYVKSGWDRKLKAIFENAE